MKAIALIALLLTGCANPMNAPAMPPRPLDAEERAIVEHTRDRQAALEMLAILHAAREMNFIDPVVAE